MPRTQGLRSFSFHTHRSRGCRRLAGRLHPGKRLTGAAARTPARALRRLAPQRAARLWLEAALGSPELPELTVDLPAGGEADYRCLAVERSVASNRWAVLFRQRYRGVEVFGSLITLELTRSNGLLSIHGAVGVPANVDPIARLAPAAAYRGLRSLAGLDRRRLAQAPRLMFYFDAVEARWVLAYLFRDVPELSTDGGHLPVSWDYVLDAHFGELVERLPRAAMVVQTATDDLGQARVIGVDDVGRGRFELRDPELRVETRDYGFKSIHLTGGKTFKRRSAESWSPVAVSAHANASDVARFLQKLGCVGRDGSGELFVQGVNCVVKPNTQEWPNSAWFRNKALYGQVLAGGQLHSYALDVDVVAHELMHGVISARPRLSVAGEPGALHESYCDLFAVAAFNVETQGVADPRDWHWVVGVEGNLSGEEPRDLSDPAATGQPAHMDGYLDLPLDALNDFGAVHDNSTIHSHAVCRLLIAEDGNGGLVLDPETAMRILFETLVHHLGPSSGFADSRRAIELVTLSEMPTDERRTAALAAIDAAFDAVGIADG